MIPVGNTGIQPDALGSISKLIAAKSGMIGLQQQQQNLQTGAYQQQSAQAGAQQDQQKNAEYQAAQKLAVSGAQSGQYTNPDGSLNRQKMADDITKVAPTYGQGIAGQLLSQANEIVANKSALQSLNRAQQEQVGATLGALATKPDVSHSDVIDALANLSDSNPQLHRMAISLSGAIPPGAQGEQLQQILQRAAIAATSAGNAADLSLPGQGQTAAGQSVNVNKITGARALPPAGPNANPLLPQQTTNAAGQIINRSPISGSLSPAPTAAPGINPTAPTVGNVAGMAQDDRGRYAQISQEGTNATQGAALADQVAQLADQVRTGKFSKFWADHLAVLKQDDPTITARQMLDKYAAQVKTMATMNASTDAERSGIDAGMPNPETMGTGAVKEAAQYVGGVFRQRGARQAYADNFVKQNGTSVGVRQADDQFMQSADPFVFTYRNLTAGPERQEFLRSHGITTPAAQAAFKDKLTKIQQYGGE